MYWHNKKAERAAMGEEVQPGLEDRDSVATEYDNPLANWCFDDDQDDAASTPPCV